MITQFTYFLYKPSLRWNFVDFFCVQNKLCKRVCFCALLWRFVVVILQITTSSLFPCERFFQIWFLTGVSFLETLSFPKLPQSPDKINYLFFNVKRISVHMQVKLHFWHLHKKGGIVTKHWNNLFLCFARGIWREARAYIKGIWIEVNIWIMKRKKHEIANWMKGAFLTCNIYHILLSW